MNSIKDKISALRIPQDRVLENEPMSKHTSFRVGGNAALYVTVCNKEELKALLSLLTSEKVEHFLIGNGSNLLFTDAGYTGVVVKLDGDFGQIKVDDCTITAGSSVILSRASSVACENSLTGMEFASGIPGSIGGAIFMNAGAYGGEMKDIVESVNLISADGSEEYTLSNEEMEFAYRHSGIQKAGAVVTDVVLRLEKGDKEQIRERIAELANKRNSKQPVNFPSAGSTFKRPVGGYAAALIEEAGLKGTSVGGAEVSTKHSGFIINKGDATATDVLELMKLVRAKVQENSGIVLEPEVRIIGGSID